MELRQLALFVFAAQHVRHAEAAEAAGIAASTLSGSLAELQAELGVPLFTRGALGQVPTEAARKLYPLAVRLLQLIEAASGPGGVTCDRALRIVSRLAFMFGPLSRAAAHAARDMWRAPQPVLADLRFVEEDLDRDEPHVVFCYGGDAPGDHVLYIDDWVAVPNDPRHGWKAVGASLQRCKLWHPPLSEAQEGQLRTYCDEGGLPQPWLVSGERAGPSDRSGDLLDVLARKGPEAVLLAPRSLVAPGLARHRLQAFALHDPLAAPVVARIARPSPDADRYVAAIIRHLAAGTPPIRYASEITMRQLHYAVEVARCRTMSEAAHRLRVSQPALSLQIGKLEAMLGVPLFRRSSRGMTRQPAAAVLLSLLVRASDTAAALRATAGVPHDREARQITLGIAPIVAHLPPLRAALARALAAFRAVETASGVTLLELPAGELIRRIRAGSVRLCLCEIAEPDLPRTDLMSLGRLGVVSCGAHQTEAGCAIDLCELVARPLVLPPLDDGMRLHLDRAARIAGRSIVPAFEVASPRLTQQIAASCGLSMVLSEAALSEIDPDDRATFRPLRPEVPVRLHLLQGKASSRPAAEEVLGRLLRDHLAACPPPPDPRAPDRNVTPAAIHPRPGCPGSRE